MTGTRAGIYTRVSSDATGRGRSVEQQLDECRAEAARRGWTVVGEWEDNDLSASRYAKKGRPQFADLERAIKARTFDVLLTWEASRLQRDLSVYVKLRDLCRESSVRLCYSGALFDFDSPDDSFRAGLDAILSERESEVTRARIMRSVRANAAAGRPHGKILWGYQRFYDPVTKVLTGQHVDPEVGLLLHEMAARVLAGESCYQIAADFNARSIPTPRGGRGWTLGQISRTLRNPGYAGLRTHLGDVVGPADWPPVFDPMTWRRLQAVLTDPARSNERPSAVRHLLSGVAVCDVCESPLRLRRSRTLWSYTCVPGFHVAMTEPNLDRIVTDLLLARLDSPRAVAMLAASAGHNPGAAEALALAEAERARLDEFEAQAVAGDISAASFARIESKILALVRQHEGRAHQHVPTAALALVGPWARERWDEMSLPQQRATLSAVMRPRLKPALRRGERGLHPERVLPGWV